jgi:hypothetical protein
MLWINVSLSRDSQNRSDPEQIALNSSEFLVAVTLTYELPLWTAVLFSEVRGHSED